MRATHDSIMDTDINVRCCREGREPGEKPSKHRQDQLWKLSYMKRHTPGLVSVMRGTTIAPPVLPYRGRGRSISGGGGAHIHIFVLCIINFF